MHFEMLFAKFWLFSSVPNTWLWGYDLMGWHKVSSFHQWWSRKWHAGPGQNETHFVSWIHHSDVIISETASLITGVSIVDSTFCAGADKRKQKSSASPAFVRGIHRWSVNSPHKGPATWKIFPFDDVIMRCWNCLCYEFEIPANEGLITNGRILNTIMFRPTGHFSCVQIHYKFLFINYQCPKFPCEDKTMERSPISVIGINILGRRYLDIESVTTWHAH